MYLGAGRGAGKSDDGKAEVLLERTPLDYQPYADRRLGRRWVLRVSMGVAVATTFGLFVNTPFHETQLSMDVITGSTESQTTWLGITFGPEIEISPLETRMKKIGVQWNRDWQFLGGTSSTILTKCRSCGSTPQIYELRPFLPEFVDVSTDSEIREFVQIMQSGTDGEKTAAIEAAEERVLNN